MTEEKSVAQWLIDLLPDGWRIHIERPEWLTNGTVFLWDDLGRNRHHQLAINDVVMDDAVHAESLARAIMQRVLREVEELG